MTPSPETHRAQAAVKAMVEIGFGNTLARAVLKKLLKVYENNWEYIEAENYRLLADSILDRQESGGSGGNRTNVSTSDVPELPRKRLRRNHEDSIPLPAAIEALASGESNTRAKRIKPVEVAVSEGENSPVSPSMHARDVHQVSDNSGTLICYKEGINEAIIENSLKRTAIGFSSISDKVLSDKSDNYHIPLTVLPPLGIPLGIEGNQDKSQTVDIHWPNASNGLTNANILEASDIWNGEVPGQYEMRSEPSRFQERVSTNTDIASSKTGEVKLSLTYMSVCPDFKAPNLESIFKIVEDRCLKSYKFLQPDFSLMNIMKEICQCAVDLAAESGKEMQKKVRKATPNGSGSPDHRTRMTSSSSGASMALVALESPRETVNNFESSQDNDMQENTAPELSCHNISQSLAVIPLQGPLLDDSDVAKGEERVRISLVNEFTSERFPAYFHYIPQNAVYQNAHVNYSLARIGDEDCCLNCFGDCLNAPIPCACTRETSGEFVYTLDGLLKKEFLDECISMIRRPDKHHHVYCKECPIEKSKNERMPDACKGHLVRKFVKECWSKCGCSKYCGNRVVQRGIARNLQVFYSGDAKGWGLRTLEELPRGAFVCEYVGEILTNIELYDRTIQVTGGARHTYPVLLDADWGSEAGLRDEEALCLDATFYGNVGRFVNHRCADANLIEVPVEWETPDHHYYHLAFFTTRKVEILEELTWDYGIDFDDRSHPIKAFKCLCGSRSCRNRNRSKARSRASGSK